MTSMETANAWRRPCEVAVRKLGRAAVLALASAVAAATVGLFSATPALAASVPSTATQQVLLIRAFWGSRSVEPSDTTAKGLAGDVQEWFSTASHGALTLETTASDWVQITGPTTGCQADKDQLMQQAKDALATNGVDVSPYEDFVLYFPTCAESPSDPATWATQGGPGVWLNGTFALHDVLNGLGQNMGLLPAGTHVCSAADMQSTCTFAEGADPFDPMGQGTTAGFNAAEMDQLGWLGSNENVSVRDLSLGGSATLARLHGTVSTTVAFLRPGNGAQIYWLEYRQPVYPDNGLPAAATSGVLVHLVSGLTSNASRLVNSRADDGSGDIWTIREGTSFLVKEGFSISVTSVSTTGADVTVTAPQQLTLTPNGTGSGTVTSNPAGITCGSTCTASYPAGESVTLTEAPATGSTFAGWSGACSGTATTCVVSMSVARSVTATFNTTASGGTRVEESAAGFDGWAVVGDPTASGGTWRASSTKGNTTTFKFTGTGVTLLTHRGPRQGIAAVTIDGISKGNVDLFASSDQAFSKPFTGLVSKAHTMVVTVTGTKNAAAATTEVIVDAFTVGTTTTQESAKTVTYEAWAALSNASASGGTYRNTAKANSTATYTFTGTGVDWITATGPTRGKASVSIDGGPAVTVDLYASTVHWKAVGRSVTGLSSGQHRVTIKVLGTRNTASTGTSVPLDAFVVH